MLGCKGLIQRQAVSSVYFISAGLGKVFNWMPKWLKQIPILLKHFFLQSDGVFQGQSHGIEKHSIGLIPDYYSSGLHPVGDVYAHVLAVIHSNVYRKMWLPLLHWRQLRKTEKRRWSPGCQPRACHMSVVWVRMKCPSAAELTAWLRGNAVDSGIRSKQWRCREIFEVWTSYLPSHVAMLPKSRKTNSSTKIVTDAFYYGRYMYVRTIAMLQGWKCACV